MTATDGGADRRFFVSRLHLFPPMARMMTCLHRRCSGTTRSETCERASVDRHALWRNGSAVTGRPVAEALLVAGLGLNGQSRREQRRRRAPVASRLRLCRALEFFYRRRPDEPPASGHALEIERRRRARQTSARARGAARARRKRRPRDGLDHRPAAAYVAGAHPRRQGHRRRRSWDGTIYAVISDRARSRESPLAGLFLWWRRLE